MPVTATDSFPNSTPGLSSPYTHAAAITKSDTDELTHVTRAIWVGGAGDMCVVTASGEEVTITSIPDGCLIPIRAKQVKATATDCTDMIALW